MILKNVITMVDNIKPNAFSNDVKTQWINEVEGLVQTDVMLIAIDDVIQYSYTADQDDTLLVKPPHDKLYETYLCAMIDFAHGEYDKYSNTMALFNAQFSEYVRWYGHSYHPADGRAAVEGYYISAYGIAVAHGYSGTEAQWLASLKGDKGDTGAGFIIKGKYATYAELIAAVTDPEVGDAYDVGTAAPYTIYQWDGVGGAWYNRGSLKGADGKGIASVQLNADYTLTITFTDGTTTTTASIRGAQGAQGKGIQSVQLNADYTLTITFTDGTTTTTTSIRGQKGEDATFVMRYWS